MPSALEGAGTLEATVLHQAAPSPMACANAGDSGRAMLEPTDQTEALPDAARRDVFPAEVREVQGG